MTPTEVAAAPVIVTEQPAAASDAPSPPVRTRPAILLPDGRVVEWPDSSSVPCSSKGWPARFDVAARLVTTLHPNPVGELVERELLSALVCAGGFGLEPHLDEDALLVRLVEHILATVERRIAVASVAPPPRPRRVTGSRLPPGWPRVTGPDDVPLE